MMPEVQQELARTAVLGLSDQRAHQHAVLDDFLGRWTASVAAADDVEALRQDVARLRECAGAANAWVVGRTGGGRDATSRPRQDGSGSYRDDEMLWLRPERAESCTQQPAPAPVRPRARTPSPPVPLSLSHDRPTTGNVALCLTATLLRLPAVGARHHHLTIDGVRAIPKLWRCVDALVRSVCAQLPPALRWEDGGRTHPMVAVYPPGSSGYSYHVDNPDKDGRVLTAVYYLNDDWVEADGGALRLYPSLAASQPEPEPEPGPGPEPEPEPEPGVAAMSVAAVSLCLLEELTQAGMDVAAVYATRHIMFSSRCWPAATAAACVACRCWPAAAAAAWPTYSASKRGEWAVGIHTVPHGTTRCCWLGWLQVGAAACGGGGGDRR
jgi:hypothetical protein